MFKKPENEYQPPEPAAGIPRSYPVEQRRESATIGPSITIKGDLAGEEDLIIQGRVEGKVDLKQNSITIGKNGRAKADIYGKLISVEGEVEGNLYGQDQIIVRSTGNVRGNLTAPRVSLEDGAKFKGSIDMDGNAAPRQGSASAPEPRVATPGFAGADHSPKSGIQFKSEPHVPKV
jgi:cytoskeletal protein CcmA (bactofilin family)